MKAELTNLLSSDRTKAQRREYFLRLAAVAAFFVGTLFVLAGVLLAPSYIYAIGQKEVHKTQLATLQDAQAAREEEGVTKRITALTADTQRLRASASSPSVSAALQSVLALPRGGILVTRFTVTAPQASGAEGTMVVSGIAASRDALRQYHDSLGRLAFVARADLPLGAYARESDIPFSITLHGPLTTP